MSAHPLPYGVIEADVQRRILAEQREHDARTLAEVLPVVRVFPSDTRVARVEFEANRLRSKGYDVTTRLANGGAYLEVRGMRR